jgi:hypothetical protein
MMQINVVMNDATRLVLRPQTKVEGDVLNWFAQASIELELDCGDPVLIITRGAK